MTSPNRLLQAALNGDRDKAAHPATPVSVKELERDASACVAAGARAIHMHPRDPEGRQTLEAGTVDGAVARVRRACGVPVGVTTSAEIEPDPERRLRLVGAWREPDYTSVNLSEPGAPELMEVLAGMGWASRRACGRWRTPSGLRLPGWARGSPGSWSSRASYSSRAAKTRPPERSSWSMPSTARWIGMGCWPRGCSMATGRSPGCC